METLIHIFAGIMLFVYVSNLIIYGSALGATTKKR